MSGQAMALEGIRILDLGQGAIDPITTSFMAGFGAEVIKVESSRHLDFIRRGQFYDLPGKPARNIQFERYNQNKMSVVINITHPKGVALVKRLAAISDVVIENFSVDVIHRLGLDYAELRQVKPDIIMLSASFGGQTGPYRNFRGQGYTIAALQGVDELTGWPDRGPVSPAAALGDHYLPWMWTSVLIAALIHHRDTGRGQFIDGSSFEGCLDVLDTAVTDYTANGRVLTRRGNRHTAAAPHGVYRCLGEDRWVAISVFNDDEWQALCRAMGSPEWARQPAFATVTGRLDNVSELDRLIEDWTCNRDAGEIMLQLQAAGVRAGLVADIEDLHRDPQLVHRQHYWEPAEPGTEKFTFEAPAARLSETPARFQRRGPYMGEHNDYVYFKLLGLSREEYSSLLAEGVLS